MKAGEVLILSVLYYKERCAKVKCAYYLRFLNLDTSFTGIQRWLELNIQNKETKKEKNLEKAWYGKSLNLETMASKAKR